MMSTSQLVIVADSVRRQRLLSAKNNLRS